MAGSTEDLYEDATPRLFLFVSFIISFMAVISSFIIYHYIYAANPIDYLSNFYAISQPILPLSEPMDCSYPGVAIIIQNILICARFVLLPLISWSFLFL
jgi:hypothetical protein